MIKASVMEMRMILDMHRRCVSSIETCQRELEIQRRDMERQVEWIKKEIDKAITTEFKQDPVLTLAWEKIRIHAHGDMGPAYVLLKDIKPIFEPTTEIP